MIVGKDHHWVTAIEQLRARAARIQRSGLADGLDEVLDQTFRLCDSLLQDLAGTQLELDGVKERLKGEASRSAETCAHLFDRMPGACIETDANGVILRANRSAALLLNMSAKHLGGRLLMHFSECRDEFDEVIRTLSRGVPRHRASMAIRPRERGPLRAELVLIPSRPDTASDWLWFLDTAEQHKATSSPQSRHALNLVGRR